MAQAGFEDGYLETLGPWHTMLANGLTTFAEEPEPTRSDCHAWSASPLYYFLSLVLGVQPAGPGFGAVAVRPHLGSLTEASGTVPHPLGDIRVIFHRSGSGLSGTVTLPPGLTGQLEWEGIPRELNSGTNVVRF